MNCFSEAEDFIVRASSCGGLKLVLMGKSASYLHVPRYAYRMCIRVVHFDWTKLHAPNTAETGLADFSSCNLGCEMECVGSYD
jgi:hypothetical protein